jgi:hypothetical protein
MVEEDGAPIGSEPERWCVCFFKRTSMPRFDRILPGRYKHVSAFGYARGADAWIFVEPGITGTKLMVEREGPRSKPMIDHYLDGADWLLLPVSGASPPVLSFLAGWCVPTIARLVGRGYGALSPDGFWRKCVPYALEVRAHEDAKAEARS